MPKISVIVPVYKVEKYIGQCIESVVSQTFKDFELMLIDDGSPDNSGAICDEYAQKDARIRVFHIENGGVSSARNYGIEKATGDWLCFIDSDDFVKEDYLKDFGIDFNISDLIIQGFLIKDKHGEREKSIKQHKDKNDLIYSAEISNILNSPCYKLYRRDIIKANELKFRSGCSYGEDHIFTLEYMYCMSSNHFVYVPRCSYVYVREGNESLSRRIVPFQSLSFYAKEIVELIPMTFRKLGLSDKVALELKNRRLFDQIILMLKNYYFVESHQYVNYDEIVNFIRKHVDSIYGVSIKYVTPIMLAKILPLCISESLNKFLFNNMSKGL